MEANERLFEVINELKDTALISDYKTLAVDMSVHKSYISDIKAGRKKISLEFLGRMKNRYPRINLDYIVLGLGTPLLRDDSPKSTEIKESSNTTTAHPETLTTYLVDTIATQAEEIGALKNEIDNLKSKLQERAQGNSATDATSEASVLVG